eukprot:COSAG01_NODE_9390_length_2459_cov_2.323305_3_plen_75_part_00
MCTTGNRQQYVLRTSSYSWSLVLLPRSSWHFLPSSSFLFLSIIRGLEATDLTCVPCNTSRQAALQQGSYCIIMG